MLRLFQPCLFFLSFLPLWLSIAFQDAMSIWKCKANIWTEVISLILMGICVFISLLVVIIQMQRAKKITGTSTVINQATKQKAITAEYLLSYILPLFAFDFTRWEEFVLFLVFFVTLTYLCLKHHHVYANIVLEICGYTCYDCTLANTDGSCFETVVVSASELTGMINHPINYIALGGGYGLKPNA